MVSSIKGLVKVFMLALLLAAMAAGTLGTIAVKTTNIIASVPQTVDMSHYGKL